MTVELISFTPIGGQLAARIAQLLAQSGHAAACTRDGLDVETWARRAFARSDALVFVGAAGIAVRAVAPCVRSKSADPAVVVVDEEGRFAVPILSGHLGGANDLARQIAALLGGTAVITTASDVRGVFAFDQWARDNGCAVPYPERILPVARKLLSGEEVWVRSEWPVEGESPAGVRLDSQVYADVQLTLRKGPENPEKIPKKPLFLVPKAVFLGVGCRKNIPLENLEGAYTELLNRADLFPESVKLAATVNLKAEEPALLAFCERHRLPLRTFSPEELAAVPGEFSASEFVRSVTGVDNICERAAVLAADGGPLLCRKYAKNGVTMALAAGKIALKWEK